MVSKLSRINVSFCAIMKRAADQISGTPTVGLKRATSDADIAEVSVLIVYLQLIVKIV